MNPTRKIFLVGLAASMLALGAVAEAAPRQGGSPGGYSGGGARPAHPGGAARPGYSGSARHGHYDGSRHYYGGHGHAHYGGSYWGWGLALGVPWGWGLYDPYWYGYGYSPYYYGYPAYGYAYGYPSGYPCGPYGECYREQLARSEPTPPTTEVPPPVPGADGAPTQRPLHLNYCDSAKAWFPQVRTCPGGWRMVRPEYSPGP
jgi:hypothetical protein